LRIVFFPVGHKVYFFQISKLPALASKSFKSHQ
jgi:hypothetical protein